MSLSCYTSFLLASSLLGANVVGSALTGQNTPDLSTSGQRVPGSIDGITKRQDEGLTPFVFEPLPLGSIKPQGWLLDQMQLMADGLAGYEHEFYPIVQDSPWLGGTSEYSALNEAFPYWFNGIVPLAYGLNDARLKDEVQRLIRHILENQQADGWLGPETDLSKRNFWGTYPMFLALTQLVEVTQGSDLAEEILVAMHKFVDLMHSMLSDNYQGYVFHDGDNFDDQWGRSRAADMIVALQWLYEKDPRENSAKLSECMKFFNDEAFDWTYWFSEGVYIKVDLDTVPLNITEALFPFEHGVNAGQGLKAGAAIHRFNQDEGQLESARRGVDWTFLYHGTPSGGIIADERLSGLSPVRGVELCSVVETMYSLSYLQQTLGDKEFADRNELAAYNALPVMLMPDWWAHQYITQTNQPLSTKLTEFPFWNVNAWGQTYGLEPNYPCCTVNHPQGYPKFLSSSFVREGEDGIAHALLAPAKVTTATQSGVNVEISCLTNYPIVPELSYSINADGPFTFGVRVPGWATESGSYIVVNGGAERSLNPDPDTGMHHVELDAGNSTISYTLSADIRVEPRANETVSIYHGSLLYAIPVGQHVETHRHEGFPQAPPEALEFMITPTTPWAFAIDPSTVRFNAAPQNLTDLPNPVWGEGAPPVSITAKVCEIEWEMAGEMPLEPPLPDNRKCTSDPYEIDLVPYGSARLHMAELPTMDLSS
ncbi:hypothetical protein FQN54_006338 [Arachnomyces sp. PD_36]|nr:hypothetical protein FQN54_006338 [Arachnomyces sp. PD_36]